MAGALHPGMRMESQLRDLEEPEDAITIPASWPHDTVVEAIRTTLSACTAGCLTTR